MSGRTHSGVPVKMLEAVAGFETLRGGGTYGSAAGSVILERLDLVLSKAGRASAERDGVHVVDRLLADFNGKTPLGPLPKGLPAQPNTDRVTWTVGQSLLAHLAGLSSSTAPLRDQILKEDPGNKLGKVIAGAPCRETLAPLVGEFLRGIVARTKEACVTLLLWLETVGFVAETGELSWVDRFAGKSWWDLLNDRYEPRMKYLTALVQARNLMPGGELPPKPDWLVDDTHFLGGSAYAWFQTRAGSNAAAKGLDTYLELNNSVTGIKKRQPTIPLTALIQSQVKWYKALSETRPEPLRPENEAEFRTVVQEIVRKMGPKLRSTATVPLPGLTARFESETRAGGTFELYRLALLVAEARHRSRYALGSEQYKEFWEPMRALSLINDESGFTLEVWGTLPLGLRELLEATVVEILVKPQMLPEPFKVRAISMGQGLAYYRTQAIQKLVHAAMQLVPEFRVTKESPDHDIIETLNQVVDPLLGPSAKFVSGDYSAATDNLKSRISEIVVEELSREGQFSNESAAAFKLALTGHTLQGPAGEMLRQTNGQLMGSPVSFPVLCIANLALTIVALRRHEGRGARRVGSSGIVINGDDIVFAATPAAIQEWRDVTSDGGLSPSPGKNFTSTLFLQLNSKMFVPRKKTIETMPLGALRDTWLWEKVPQASLQVLAPPRSVPFNEFCLSAPQWQATFLDEFTGKTRDRLNSLFIECWRPFLSMLPADVMNWFIPRDLGGFGLSPTRPVVSTVKQQHIAAYFRDNTNPETARLQRLRWMPVEAKSSAYSDTSAVVRKLVGAGVVEWRWLGPDEEELDTSVLTQSLVLSGYARPTVAGTMGRIERPQGQAAADRLAPQAVVVDGPGPLQALKTYAIAQRTGVSALLQAVGYQVADEDERDAEPKKAGGVDENDAAKDDSWLYQTLRLLRKVATRTSRVMSSEDIAAWTPRRAGYVPAGAWREQAVRAVSISLRSDRLTHTGVFSDVVADEDHVDLNAPRGRVLQGRVVPSFLRPRPRAQRRPAPAVLAEEDKGIWRAAEKLPLWGPFDVVLLDPPLGWGPGTRRLQNRAAGADEGVDGRELAIVN